MYSSWHQIHPEYLMHSELYCSNTTVIKLTTKSSPICETCHSFFEEKVMCHEHSTPHVMLPFPSSTPVTAMYSLFALAYVGGPPMCLCLEFSIARLAIFLIMHALFLQFLLSWFPCQHNCRSISCLILLPHSQQPARKTICCCQSIQSLPWIIFH